MECTTVDETTIPAAVQRTPSFRWRLIPAAILMIFGALNVALIAVILGALLVGKHFNYRLFDGPSSPELTPLSLAGMGLLACLGFAWCIAGRLIWKRKVLSGLLLAVVSYPIGAYGVNWMFSSPPDQPPPNPNLTQPPFPPPRFDNPRKPPPTLAIDLVETDENRPC